MNYQFYKDEREEHRYGLGKYAGQRKYVSAYATLTDLGVQGHIDHPTLQYISDQCDNLNLVEDQKGLFCEYCCHYHAKFTLKGIVRVYEPLPQRGYDTPERTFINPGKYRSDWTSDDECFEDPYPEELPPVDLTPGDDFWARVREHVSRYGLKVEVT